MPRTISTRLARQTRTSIDVIDARDEGERWETVCYGTPDDPHNGVCSHDTRALAEFFAAAPREWCEECMHRAGLGPDPYDDPYRETTR